MLDVDRPPARIRLELEVGLALAQLLLREAAEPARARRLRAA